METLQKAYDYIVVLDLFYVVVFLGAIGILPWLPGVRKKSNNQ
jgi:hypothetical protein